MDEKNIEHTRPERRDAAENRQRILDAALRLFEQNGVEQVSMNQIATEAQIGPGTLYRRYRNKSELCLDLIKDNIVLLFDDIDEYLEANRKNAPDQRLRGLLDLFIRFREKKAQLLTGVEESTPINSFKSRMQSPLHDDLHQLFVELFDEMHANEQNYLNSVFRADMLLMALSKDFYSFQRNVRGYTPELLLEQLGLIFLN
ncbi:tetr bacterial regulatory protein hth signature [Lucifera butyrica]|uniref:Tetr bacterial regulatory protein hth signature n=1 Tax=Lucifera butyrica TaxID=1351585 RepID=A0A498RGX1_9FIRM|nr:TetR/AcrR family transcriptional regulator [Lucifera butyrica]VBB08306.1 tetr bacterial regulatory protein hth signature [Lucifera butyrica]VBB08378.1 tetr bacterial regulatory protein hth signature [Lucifera butyrica]